MICAAPIRYLILELQSIVPWVYSGGYQIIVLNCLLEFMSVVRVRMSREPESYYYNSGDGPRRTERLLCIYRWLLNGLGHIHHGFSRNLRKNQLLEVGRENRRIIIEYPAGFASLSL